MDGNYFRIGLLGLGLLGFIFLGLFIFDFKKISGLGVIFFKRGGKFKPLNFLNLNKLAVLTIGYQSKLGVEKIIYQIL